MGNLTTPSTCSQESYATETTLFLQSNNKSCLASLW